MYDSHKRTSTVREKAWMSASEGTASDSSQVARRSPSAMDASGGTGVVLSFLVPASIVGDDGGGLSDDGWMRRERRGSAGTADERVAG